VDFVTLAFRLFGVQVASLYAGFFLLLAVQVAAYIWFFFRRPDRLLVPLALLASVYAFAFAIPLTRELGTILEPRLFDVLGLLPLFSLLLLPFEPRRRAAAVVSFAGVQLLMLLFVYHVREAGVRLVMAYAGSLPIVIALGRRRLPELAVGMRLPPVAGAWRGAWPVLVLVLGVAALSGYQRLAYHPRYYENALSSHILWHNIFMGLAVNPRLASRYAIDIDDGLVIDAAKLFLEGRGDAERSRWTAIFGQDGYSREGYAHFNWRLYDTAVRDLTIDALRSDPMGAAAAFVYHKPALLLRQGLWAAGYYRGDPAALHLKNHRLADAKARHRSRLYWNPLRLDILILLALAAALAAIPAGGVPTEYPVIGGLVVLFSLIPAFIAYPVIHVAGVVFVSAAVALHLALLTGVLGAWRRLVPQR
jgi:hypothetical protein